MLDRDREALEGIRARESVVSNGYATLRCDECGVEELTTDCLRLAQQCRDCHGWMRLVPTIAPLMVFAFNGDDVTHTPAGRCKTIDPHAMAACEEWTKPEEKTR